MTPRSGIDILVVGIGLVMICVSVFMTYRSIVGWRAIRNKPHAKTFRERQASSPLSLMIPALFGVAIGAFAIVTGLFGHDGVLSP